MAMQNGNSELPQSYKVANEIAMYLHTERDTERGIWYTQFLTFRSWESEHPQLFALLVVAIILVVGITWWWIQRRQFYQTANGRAELLLQQSLTLRQYYQLQSLGFLEIPSRTKPNEFYRIPRHPGRVQLYEIYGGSICRLKAELCVISCEEVPDADLILAHKWMIEGNEITYQAVANWKWRHDSEWTAHVNHIVPRTAA